MTTATTETSWVPVPGDVYASLTRAGKDSLTPMRQAHEHLAEVVRHLEVAQSEMHATVYDALQAKVPARVVADMLSISVSRVYQIRDEVTRHRVTVPATT
jgi:hypothetical protein